MKAPARSVQWLIVGALAIAAFVPAIGGALVSDDHSLIGVASPDLMSALSGRFWQVRGQAETNNIYAGAYRPLTQLFYALEKGAFGSEPVGFHLVSLGLHAVNALLVLRLLRRRVLGSRAELAPEAELAVLLAAVLFAVHPAHAESVAWISGATDLLMTLCLLGAFELLEHGPIARASAVLAFACAVFAKEPAAVAPALCLLDGWARGLPKARLRSDVALAAVGALGALGVTIAVGLGHPRAPIQINVVQALAVTGQYVRAALWPAHLHFSAPPHPVGPAGLYVDPALAALGGVAWCALLLCAALGLRAPRMRALCADGAWFCLPLLPVVLLLQLLFSDRFLYAPLIGLCALLARELASLLTATRVVRSIALGAVCAVGAASLSRSVEASRAFLDDEALWASQVRAYPDSPNARDSLAEALVARGAYDEARAHLERGLHAAAAIGQREMAGHFIAHLIALPTLSRPEWDSAARAATERGCNALLGAHRAQYASASVSVRFDVTPSALRSLEQVPALLLVPCTRALLDLQRPDDAVRMASRAVAIAPGDVGAAEIHALALARAGAYRDALTEALRALALRDLAQLHDLVRRIEAAAALDRAPIQAGDEKAQAMKRFQIAMTLGSPLCARAALDALVHKLPTDPELVHALVASYVAERRFELGQQVIGQAERAAPSDPQWPQMALALGAAEAELRAKPPAQGR